MWDKVDGFYLYLIVLGTRLKDYTYTPEQVYEHLKYFRQCYARELSPYKALEFFYFYLEGDYDDSE